MGLGQRIGRQAVAVVGRRGDVVMGSWALGVAAMLIAVPVLAQSAPDSATLPPRPTDGAVPQPRSDNPLVDGGGVRPIPDSGVIKPPMTGLGSPAVIAPPATGTMPVIKPPIAGSEPKAVTPH